MRRRFSTVYIISGVVLLIVFSVSLIGAAQHDSQTIDEGAHLAAGASYVATGDWRLNPEHPPLVKVIAGLFVTTVSPRLALDSAAWQEYDQWNFGRLFLYHNTLPADTLLFLGRLGTILFALTLAIVIWLWAWQRYGPRTGIAALLLTVFEPTLLAHGHLVTTDVPLALTFFVAVIAFSNYLEKPTRRNLIISIVTFVIAQLTKFSAVVLVPIFIVLYIVHRWYRRPDQTQPIKGLPLALLFICSSLLLIWLAYGFQMVVPATDPQIKTLYSEREAIIASGTSAQYSPFVQKAIGLFDPTTGFGKSFKQLLETAHVPAYSYWRGLFGVFAHNGTGHGAYLLGQISHYGWWYFFPLAFLFKTPLALLLLIALAVSLLIRRLVRTQIKNVAWNWYVLVIPTTMYWLSSMMSQLNLGIRHLAPTYPFMIIGAALAANWLWRRRVVGKISVVLLFSGMIVSSLHAFPTYITYFNEAAGGPDHGHELLLDSNLDWGQELKNLGTFVTEHQITSIRVAYFGSAEVSYYVPRAQSVPTNEMVAHNGLPNDVVAISSELLYDPSFQFQWLQAYKPTAILGHQMYIFDFR